jgi:hypothetical protein
MTARHPLRTSFVDTKRGIWATRSLGIGSSRCARWGLGARQAWADMANAALAAFIALSTRQVAMRSHGEQHSPEWYRRYRSYSKGSGLYDAVQDGY